MRKMYAMLIARDDGSFFYALSGHGLVIDDFSSAKELEDFARKNNIDVEWISDKYSA